MPGAIVGVEDGDAFREFLSVRFRICIGAENALLFPSPQSKADGTARRLSQTGDRARCFQHCRSSGPVVLCASTKVPRIKMSADENPFVGMLAAGNFGNDVVDLYWPADRVLRLKPDLHRLPGVLQKTPDQVGIFHANL